MRGEKLKKRITILKNYLVRSRIQHNPGETSPSAEKMRSYPNIIITGTPGVGKTTTITELLNLASSSSPPIPLKHLSINDIVKSRDCHEGYDDNLQTYIVDDDKLMDEVENDISDGEGDGGFVIDWHSTAGFAVRWVDLVVVLRCAETDVLFDRLSKRGYKEEKVQENMDAEIFGVVLEEAKEGWEEEQVVELSSVDAEDVETNAERVLQWIKAWVSERKQEADGSG